MIHLAILTSSRADFGIYEPLIDALKEVKSIKTGIIAFGTHLSKDFGYSINQVKKTGIPIINTFNTAPLSDSPSGITLSMIKTMRSLVKVWETNKFDLVIALGDRYEMFAAVSSSLPYNIKIAHIHGGETTIGAIDNALRHSITHMSSLHFTSSEPYKQRVIDLLGHDRGVYNTGALSIDKLSSLNFLSKDELKHEFNIDLHIPTFLITLHPETIGYEKNESYAQQVLDSLYSFNNYQQVITMPNADTSGQIIRRKLYKYAKENRNVILIENFGSLAYLTVMKYASLIIGNSSSGFIEAAWFPRWVVNIGNRQTGRIRTPNIIDVPFDKGLITEAINKALKQLVPEVGNIYGDGNASQKIIKHILNEFNIY